MKRTHRTCALGLLAVLALGAAGCGASGGPDAVDDPRPSTTATSQPTADPADADEVVWQESTGGGFVPTEYALTEVPDVTIYADGRIFVTVLDADGNTPRPVSLEEAQVDPEVLADFLVDAEASGLFAPGTDFGSPGVTDQASTTVTLREDGPPQTVSVYALGFDASADQPGGVTAEQTTRRQALTELLAQARALAEDAEPWVPDRIRATLLEFGPGVELPADAPAWPGPPLDAFPASTDGSGQSCLVIEGAEAAAITTAAADDEAALWDVGGEIRQIVTAPLLPGQEGCPPA